MFIHSLFSLTVILGDIPNQQSKKFIFVRHAESTWNEFRDKYRHLPGDQGFPKPLSDYYDANLSPKGIQQARKLGQTIRYDRQFLEMLSKTKTTFAVSNMRRAALTFLIGFAPVLMDDKFKRHKIFVLSSAQEMSPSADARSNTPVGGIPNIRRDLIREGKPRLLTRLYKRMSGRLNRGEQNKPNTDDWNGPERLDEFCDWMFKQAGGELIILGGHSSWFMNFFERFHRDKSNESRLEKYVKGKVVPNTGGVEMEVGYSGGNCHIIPQSSKTLFWEIPNPVSTSEKTVRVSSPLSTQVTI